MGIQEYPPGPPAAAEQAIRANLPTCSPRWPPPSRPPHKPPPTWAKRHTPTAPRLPTSSTLQPEATLPPAGSVSSCRWPERGGVRTLLARALRPWVPGTGLSHAEPMAYARLSCGAAPSRRKDGVQSPQQRIRTRPLPPTYGEPFRVFVRTTGAVPRGQPAPPGWGSAASRKDGASADRSSAERHPDARQSVGRSGPRPQGPPPPVHGR